MSRKMEELLSEIVQTDFHKVAGEEWDAVFDKLLILLGADDPEIVEEARRWTGRAIWAGQCDPNAGQEVCRLRLTEFLARLSRQADVVDRMLGMASHARSIARDKESSAEFLEWIDSFQPPVGLARKWDEVALIFRLQLSAFGHDLKTASPQLTEFLDHESLQVRACAASALARLINGRIVGLATLGELLRDIHDREIVRPGIAGPFYGVICYHLEDLPGHGRAALKAWMLSIIENRKVPEPPLLEFHFVGIDFHAHELFDGDPGGVWDLIRIGRADIAVAAATNKDRIIEGMENALIELGNSDDAEVCRLASWHLAYHYRILHPRGRERGFITALLLPGGEELFLKGCPENPRYPFAATLYPPDCQSFTSGEAAEWIDRLLPVDLRGETKPFFPGHWPGLTVSGGQVTRNRVRFRWACGAMGSLNGDTTAHKWDSLMIVWHGEAESWTPADYVAEL